MDDRSNEQSPIIVADVNNILAQQVVLTPQKVQFVFSLPSNSTAFFVRRNGRNRDYYMIPYIEQSLLNAIKGHKLYFSTDVLSVAYDTMGGYTWDNTCLIDLTKMFGSDAGIVSALGLDSVSDITANNGVKAIESFKNLFPAEYYAYDPGSLLNVNPTTLRTVGFNQFNPSDKYAHVLGGMKYEVTGTYGSLSFKKDKESSTSTAVTVSATTENQSGNTIDSYQGFTPESDGWVYASAGNDVDTNIHLVWSGYKNGSDNYEPYWQSNLDLSWIRSIEYNGQALFPDGLKGIGDVHDEVTSTKAIKRIGSVDLSALTFTKMNQNYSSYASPLSNYAYNANIKCNRYTTSSGVWADTIANGNIAPYLAQTNNIIIRDDNYSTSGLFMQYLQQQTQAGTPVMLYYELATPIEVTFDEEKSLNYREDDFGTEWLLNESSGSTVPGMCKPSDVSIMYQTNLRDYLRNLPSELDTRFDAKANTQGYYPDLQVGLSDNLYSPDGTTDNDTWLFRTSAGNQDIGTGFATLQKLEGQSIVWNQYVNSSSSGTTLYGITYTKNDNGSYTINGSNTSGSSSYCFVSSDFSQINGHRYLFKGGDDVVKIGGYMIEGLGFSGGDWVGTATSTGTQRVAFIVQTGRSVDNKTYYPQIFDLTKMFGSDAGIISALGLNSASDITDNYGAKAIQAFNRLFPVSMYSYDSGTLMNFNPESLDTVGFNLYNPETGTAELPGETGTPDFTDGKYCYQITGTYTSIAAEDGTTITPNANGYFNVDKSQTVTVVGGNDTDTCIHLCWSGYRNGDYEPYEQYGMNLSWIRDIEYTPEGETEPVKLFPDGLKGIGDVYDEVTATKAIKRIGSVDMGTISWSVRSEEYGCYIGTVSDKAIVSFGIENLMCSKYVCDKAVYSGSQVTAPDKSISNENNTNRIYVKDTSYTTLSSFVSAMSGVTLYYELATPIEVTFDQPKTLNYRVNDFGTEKFTAPEGATAPGQYYPKDVQIKYQDNLRDKVRNMEANFVSFTTDQTESATESQKAQARENLGMPVLLNEKANVNGAYPQLTAGNLISDSSILRQFYYDKTAGEGNEIGSGHATVNQVRGNTIVWNQLVTYVTPQEYTQDGVTFVCNGYEVTVSTDENGATGNPYILYNAPWIVGHRYFLRGCPAGGSNRTYSFQTGYASDTGSGVLWTCSTNLSYWPRIVVSEGTVITTPITFHPQMYDLTQMFGSTIANAMTIADFNKMFPSQSYPYNAGQLISCGPTAVVSTGFNLWDEEWELGAITSVDGSNVPGTSSIRSKNFIKVSENTQYYFKQGISTMWVFEYDVNKSYLGMMNNGSSFANDIKTTRNSTAFIRFGCHPNYGTVYKNDICINFSDPSRNGTYLPYQKDEQDLSWISELTYTPEGASEPVQMFPNGLCSAGTVYDEITPTKAIKRIGSVDLSTLSWTSGSYQSLSTFWQAPFSGYKHPGTNGQKCNLVSQKYDITYTDYIYVNHTVGLFALSGLTTQNYAWASRPDTTTPSGIVYYELDTPIEIPLNKNLGYAVQPGGTEQLLPENQPGQTPVTTQIIMDVTYPLDAVGTLQNLPNNYTSLQVMDNFASSLAQALTSAVGATSITRNSNGTWTITITPAS